MLIQLLTIAKNAFFESIRQPIVLILLITATLLLLLASPLSAFTMENDQRMLLDIGLATVFMIGMLLAIFVSSNVLGQEIRNKTTLTIVSKPIGRPSFIIGKFLGSAAAISISLLYVSLVFLLVEQQEVFQTVRVPVHLPVLLFSIVAFVVGTSVAVWCNYFYDFVFSCTWICVTTPMLAIAYVLALNFTPDFSSQQMWVAIKPDIWKALLAVFISVLILGSIAIALSTRLSQIGTLIATILVFFAGMMADAWLGRPIHTMEQRWMERAEIENKTELVERVRVMQKTNGDIDEVVSQQKQPIDGVSLTDFSTGVEYPAWIAYHIGYAIVPNFQVLWLTDALTQENVIPSRYLLRTSGYGILYIVAALSCGIILFQRREVS